ncbi:MAG TPA: FAD-binding oxidoreductase [Caldilineae bacterium]|nr:FAD-binding oxidoreductase [Caldilineae bacterium]
MMSDLAWLQERFGPEGIADDERTLAAHAIGDMRPTVVVSPPDAQGVADTLRWASEHGLAVVPWGGGTQQAAMLAPERYDLALRTGRLREVIEYEPAELVITVEAGITVSELAEILAPHQQFLPVTVPQPQRATIGGLIATNAAGPERLHYGAMRDLVLGVTVALTDGSLIRGGGRVVKNVAGYDLTRLFNGSWGTLGVITAASLRLSPVPAVRRTLVMRCASWEGAQEAALALYHSRLGPQGLTIAPIDSMGGGTLDSLELLIRFGGLPTTVERQMAEAQKLAEEAGARLDRILEGKEEATLWIQLVERAHQAPGVHLQASVLPSQVAEAVHVLSEIADAHGWPSYPLAHAGAGTVLTAWDAPGDAPLAEAISTARTHLRVLGGWLFIRRAPPQKAPLDYWGETTPGARPLMRRIKEELDPAGILNPGRFLV